MAELSAPVMEAMSRVIAQHPFFACYLYDQMRIVETESIPTAGTDSITIWINPKWFAKKTLAERVFIIAHEVMHGILDHIARGKGYKDRGFGPDLSPWKHGKANRAMDYIINDMLYVSKVGRMPEDALHHPDYNYTMIWDEVYCDLDDQPEDEGGGGGHDEHIYDGPGGTGDGTSESGRTCAITTAKNAAKAIGKYPAALAKVIGDILEPSQDWKEILRQTMTANAGKDASTWARPNRRRLAMPPHIYMPGATGFDTGGVIVGLDVSGSVSEEEKSQFLGELSYILSECKPEWLVLLWVDTEVMHVDEISDVAELADIELWDGGGTDMPVIFDWIKNDGRIPETCLILTDGYTEFGEEQAYRVIWGITAEDIKATHGETIHIDVKEVAAV